MVGCSAFGCSSSKRNSPDKSFHSFPFKDAPLLKQWRVAVRRQHVDGHLWVPGKNCRLCSDHFKDSDFQVRPGTERKLLKLGAVPSVFKAHPQHLQIRYAVRRSPRKRSHCDTGGNSNSSPHMSDEHIESIANSRSQINDEHTDNMADSSSQMSDEPSGSGSLSRPGSAVDHIYSKPSSHLKKNLATTSFYGTQVVMPGGSFCVALGCSNSWSRSRERPIKFHGFPLKNPELCKAWLVAIRREDFAPTATSKICSDHFHDADYSGPPKGSRLLENVVPSLFNFPAQLQSRKRQHSQATIPQPSSQLLPSSSDHTYHNRNDLDNKHGTRRTKFSKIKNKQRPRFPANDNSGAEVESLLPSNTRSFSTNHGYTKKCVSLCPSNTQRQLTSVDHAYTTNKDEELNRLELRNGMLEKKVKALSSKVYRQKSALLKLKNLMNDLRRKNLFEKEHTLILDECLLEC